MVENRSGKLATLPLLMAERDREYLKQLRRNRDEEADLMKNVPGWVVGTWYGEPIFKTKPNDAFLDPSW
jgi:NADH dehydrogenase (ubiquinone) 1 alpha subcomplex subunit 13